MSGLFAELVQRGAGIAPSAGVPLLRLRPRARFEPLAGLPEGDALIGMEEHTALSSPPAMASATSGVLEQPAQHSEALFVFETVSTRDAALSPVPVRLPEEIGRPAQASPPAALQASGVAGPPELPAPVDLPPSPIAPAMRSSPVQAQEDLLPVEASRPQPVLLPAEAAGPAPVLALELPVRSPPFPPALTDQPASEPVAPQITIAIDRIDIAFAPAPAPRSPASVAIPRSSGFAAYARARRGLPR
jgi:hypothetical protein